MEIDQIAYIAYESVRAFDIINYNSENDKQPLKEWDEADPMVMADAIFDVEKIINGNLKSKNIRNRLFAATVNALKE